MSQCYFVQPDEVRLPLSDGGWVEVRRELNTGQQRAMFAEMRRQFAPGEEPVLDGVLVGPARAAAYILRWSFVDTVGKITPFSRDAFDSLNTRKSKEILQALNAHEERLDAEQEEKKLSPQSPSFAATLASAV